MLNHIYFVSSNYTWGGSEVLWLETAALLAKQNFSIHFGTRYEPGHTQLLIEAGAHYIDLTPTYIYPSMKERALRKLGLRNPPVEIFKKTISEIKPQLVVISQGNNVDGKYFMTTCKEENIPYVTITQLVTDILWPFLNDDQINELRLGYQQAKMNYFVSQKNLDLHTKMLGEEPAKAKIVLNPFAVPVDVSSEYPPVKEIYNLALVGRLEMLHKGHDLLLEVLQQTKWKTRPVHFNLYGSGSHKDLFGRLLQKSGVSNVFLKGQTNNVAEIWENNHLLILPSRMEGQALALIEAMWCYRGAVVTDVGGANELVTEGETGFIADYPTVEHIDKALEKAWSVRDQWQQIGYNAGRKIRELYKEPPITSFANEIKSLLPAG